MEDEQNNNSEEKNQFLIPASIIVAGAIIAFAVFYSRGPAPVAGVKDNSVDQAKNSAAAAEVSKISAEDFVLGDKSAKVVFIEYGDYQCPFCKQFFQTVEPQIIDQYVKTGKVAFVWRDFAFLDGSPDGESHLAAEAARCAGEQNKFWEYHDELFRRQGQENGGAFKADNLKKFATSLGLNRNNFDSCLDSRKYKKAVADSTQGGGVAGVNGTPASFISGKFISGAAAYSSFASEIDAALKK